MTNEEFQEMFGGMCPACLKVPVDSYRLCDSCQAEMYSVPASKCVIVGPDGVTGEDMGCFDCGKCGYEYIPTTPREEELPF